MKAHLRGLASLALAGAACLASSARAGDWVSLFNGRDLSGWHVSAKTGHSQASKQTTGGKWEAVDGAVTGSQDIPGNGGIILTDAQYGDFEVALEMRNDFGPDSGLFLRSTEDGKAYQAMIDYHAGGNVMGIYGEGLGGKPHIRNYSFKTDVTEIAPAALGSPAVALPVLPEAWRLFWRHGEWNELRARITGGERPTITTWINGVKFAEWTETEARHPARGSIALQIHGGGRREDYEGKFVRYRNIRLREIGPGSP